MKFTRPLRQIVTNQTLEALKRSISKTIQDAAPHIQAAKEKQMEILGQKFTQFNKWYMRITGLDKVYLCQEKVTALQDQLLQIQEKRREVGRQLNDVRQRSMELQDEIHKIKRQDDLEKYLDLMKRETEVLKLEKSIAQTFQEYDQTERELFTAFTDSIRDSHEKQRAQMEYTKYFGIILSIVGSFFGFLYSSIRKEQLKRIIDERLARYSPHDSIFVSQLMKANQNTMNEVLRNREVLVDISRAVQRKSLKLSNNIMPDNASEALVIDVAKVFGAFVVIYLIAKVFSG